METPDYLTVLAALERAVQSPHVTKAGVAVLMALVRSGASARAWRSIAAETLATHTALAEATVRRQVRALDRAGAIDLRPAKTGHRREVRLSAPPARQDGGA